MNLRKGFIFYILSFIYIVKQKGRNQQPATLIDYALFCMFSFVEMIETNRISPVSPLTVHNRSAP